MGSKTAQGDVNNGINLAQSDRTERNLLKDINWKKIM